MMFWVVRRHLPLVPELEHQAEVWSAAFSPDGTRVATASLDKTARVWNATTGKPVTGSISRARTASITVSRRPLPLGPGPPLLMPCATADGAYSGPVSTDAKVERVRKARL